MVGLSWTMASGEVHMVPPPGDHFTPCCNLGLSELPPADTLTDIPEEVTCPVSWRGRAIGSSHHIERNAEAEGSLERLLKIRARIVRASSSEINSGLRD